MRRWQVLAGALMVQLCLGAIYAWGTFVPMFQASRPELALMLRPEVLGVDPQSHAAWTKFARVSRRAIAEATGPSRVAARQGWAAFLDEEIGPALEVPEALWSRYQPGLSATRTEAIFTTTVIVLALVTVVSGRLQDRVGPRPVALAGCLMLASGYLVASWNVTSFPWVLFWVGLVGGAGIGCAYVCPIAACMKWFPRVPGPITGLAVAGSGVGAYVLIQWIGPWGGWLERGGLPLAFKMMGVAFAVVGGLGALLLADPPRRDEVRVEFSHSSQALPDHSQAQMIATGAFWKGWMAFALAAGSGLMVIGALKDFGVNEGGLSEGAAEQALAMLALFNGMGRITWGTLAHRWGVRAAMAGLMLLQAVALASLPLLVSRVAPLALAACCVGFQFGGGLATFPLWTAERFGLRHLGGNYGMMFTAYGVGGLLGPLLAGLVWDAAGSYRGAFWAAAGACVAASALVASTPKQPATTRNVGHVVGSEVG